MKHIKILTIAALFFAGNLFASDEKISGYMFGDYYWVAANHDSTIEGSRGFRFRRIYFTYDQGLDESFYVRFRLEMNSPGDFTSSSKLTPFLKDAYLKWKHGRHNIIVGISGTPTWSVIEKIWGYRSVEKTPLDLHKYGSSRDFGIAFKGNLDKEKRISYHLMFANGSSTKSETNKGRKILFALSGKLTRDFIVEGYADFEERPGHANRYTLQAFAAYQRKDFRLGLQLAYQNRQVAQGVNNFKLKIGSVFAAAKFSEKAWWFARVDRLFDSNPDGAKISYIPFDVSAKSNFFLAGLDFRPIETVHIMPNIEAIFYDKVSGEWPDTDVIPRITFYYVWK